MRGAPTLSFKIAASVLALAVATPQVYAAGLGPSGGPSTGTANVSVTSASPNILINPSPGTGTFTVATTVALNAQTGTSYTFAASDGGKLVTFNNASAVAAILPQATGTFGAGFGFTVQNKGAGTVTITPATSTINGGPTLAIGQNQGCDITSDGTNWQVSACTALVTGGSGSPGGSSGQLQYNNSGAFGGITGATWNGTTLALLGHTVTGTIDLSGGSSRNINMNANSTIQVGGVDKIAFDSGNITLSSGSGSLLFTGVFAAFGTNGAGLATTAPSGTAPSLEPNWGASGTTGIGSSGTNLMDFIANATDVARISASGLAMITGVLTTKGYTVSTLPASPATGSEAYVTDANAACTYGGTPTGGGSTFCKVIYNGSAWKED